MFDLQESGVICKQLNASSILTVAQYRDISKLIFYTDRFIYPALFGNGTTGLENAMKILPDIFERSCDEMFHKQNLYIAFKNTSIVGLLLWHKGRLNWDPSILVNYAEKNDIELNKCNIEKVHAEYVMNRYSDRDMLDEQKISIINICVKESFRGHGIATSLISSFIEEHKNERMELNVLSNNNQAITVYLKMGFEVCDESPGFSLTNAKPPCLTMVREL